MLQLILNGMIDGLCDLNVLLDPMFLHFPCPNEVSVWYPGLSVQRTNIPNLITALLIDHAAERWRNQFRPSIAPHPGSTLPRFMGKFFFRK